MLTTIKLDGFKGQRAKEYDLRAPLLLLGDNGAGKSAVTEGIIYALTGHTAAGDTAGAQADLFSDRGGTVTLIDDTGHWIRRGVRKGAKSASRILETSDTPENASQPTMTRWQTTSELLDMAELRAMSADKRRAFILRICGGGQSSADVLAKLETEIAHNIAGAAATVATLEHPDGLPDDMAAICKDYCHGHPGARGVREFLRDRFRADDESLAETVGKAREDAREGLNMARAEAKQSDAALVELDTALMGTRATESECAAARDTVVRAQREVSNCETALAMRQRSDREIAELSKQVAADETRLAESDRVLAVAEEPPPAPEPLEESDEEKNLRDELTLIERKLQVGVVHEEPLTRQFLRDHLDWYEVNALRDPDTYPGAWQEHAVELLNKIAVLIEPPLGLNESAIAELTKASAEKFARIQELRRARALKNEQAITVYDRQRRAYGELRQGNEHARHTLEHDRVALEATRHTAAKYPPVVDCISRLATAKAVLKAAQDASAEAERRAGAMLAVEQARERVRYANTRVKTWTAVVPAIDKIRETLVDAGVQPVLEEMREICAAAQLGVPYCELAGRSCELGVSRNGARIRWECLSAGEGTMFSAALAIALMRRAPGLRALCIEADPLDDDSLACILGFTGAARNEFDCVVVATARDEACARAVVPEAQAWQVVSLRG